MKALPAFLLRVSEMAANLEAREEQRPVLGARGYRFRRPSRAVAKVESNISEETKCRRALVKVFGKYPEKVAIKEELSKLFPHLGKLAFERAFSAAVQETGAVPWIHGGRPSKSKLVDTNEIAALIKS